MNILQDNSETLSSFSSLGKHGGKKSIIKMKKKKLMRNTMQSHLQTESKKCKKLMNMTKKKQSYRYKE